MTIEDFKMISSMDKLIVIYQKLIQIEELIKEKCPQVEHTCEHSGITFPLKQK